MSWNLVNSVKLSLQNEEKQVTEQTNLVRQMKLKSDEKVI